MKTQLDEKHIETKVSEYFQGNHLEFIRMILTKNKSLISRDNISDRLSLLKIADNSLQESIDHSEFGSALKNIYGFKNIAEGLEEGLKVLQGQQNIVKNLMLEDELQTSLQVNASKTKRMKI